MLKCRGLPCLRRDMVGSARAFQLSSHWEIRSYEVQSKWNIFIDACVIRIKAEEGQKKKQKRRCGSDRAGCVTRDGLCGALHDFFLQRGREREWWGYTAKPLSELQVQVRTWRSCELERQAVDGLRHRKHGLGEAGQWEGVEGGKPNKNQWTLIIDYLWKRESETPRTYQWTKGIKGAGLWERGRTTTQRMEQGNCAAQRGCSGGHYAHMNMQRVCKSHNRPHDDRKKRTSFILLSMDSFVSQNYIKKTMYIIFVDLFEDLFC